MGFNLQHTLPNGLPRRLVVFPQKLIAEGEKQQLDGLPYPLSLVSRHVPSQKPPGGGNRGLGRWHTLSDTHLCDMTPLHGARPAICPSSSVRTRKLPAGSPDLARGIGDIYQMISGSRKAFQIWKARSM